MHTKVIQNHIKHSRILTITGLTSTLLLSLLILTIYQPLYYHGKNEQKVIATTGSSIQATTSLSITTASNVAGVDLLVKDNNGTFASSDDNGNTLGFNVATDYHNGYTLSIASAGSNSNSNNDGKLIYEVNSSCKESNTCPAFTSISSASSTITTNGTWGYKPSTYYNTNTGTTIDNSSNSNNNGNGSNATGLYFPSPTTTPTILDKTTTANTTGTSNSYNIAIGAKADYNQTPGVYSNSYTLQAIVNIVEHAITFNKDDNITSIVIKDANDTSNTTIATITNNTDTINLIYGDTYTIELNFADNYELDSMFKSSGVGELTIDTSGSSTNTTKATFTVGNGVATIDAKSKSSKVYMQDFTLEQCKQNVGTNGNAANIGDNITVYDRRDNNDYTVRYINGACWMTQNLRFTGTELDNTTSNVADTYTPSSPYYVNGSSVKAWKSLKDDSVCKGTSLNASNSTSLCMEYSGNATKGAWYNYAGASAGTITGTSNSAIATYDICPKSWHLPTGPAHDTSSEFYKLYRWTDESGITGEYLTAFNAVIGGRYYNGATNNGKFGYWWSANSNSAAYRYFLAYDGSRFDSGSLSRTYSFFVRCVRTS